MKRTSALLLILLLSISCYAQDNNAGVVYGKDWAYMFVAPSGWIWDSQSLAASNIYGLFHKKGQSFDPERLHIYINPTALPENISLAKFISNDIASFKSNYKNVQYEQDHTRITKTGTSLDIYHLNDSTNSYYQLISFVPFEKVIFIVVLSARSIDERTQSAESYYELLDTFLVISKQ